MRRNKYTVIGDLIHLNQKRIYHALKHNYWLEIEGDHLLKQIHQADSRISPTEPDEYLLSLTYYRPAQTHGK